MCLLRSLQTVSVHFLLNHSLEFLENDQTAYFCLNEGTEAKNKEVDDVEDNGKQGEEEKNALRLVLSKQRQVQEENASSPDCTARDKPNPCVDANTGTCVHH
jgi:hypothetical protein